MFKTKFKNTKNLLKVISSASNILSKNKMDNELKLIKLENFNGKLKLIAQNSFMYLEHFLEEVISLDGESMLYDSKTLIALLNVMDGIISIDGKEIKNEKCRYKIANSEATNYPIIQADKNNGFELKAEEFINAINNVITATDNTTEGILSGVCFNKRLAACDMKRVFISKIDINNEQEVIISKDVLGEITRLPFENNIKIGLQKGKIVFYDNNTFVSCNLLSGNYPKYEAVLPKDVEFECEFNKEDMEQALNLVNPIVDTSTGECILKISNGIMQISASAFNNEAETSIVIKNKNEIIEPKIAKFNIKFLIDMLRANQDTIKVKTFKDGLGFMFSSGNAEQLIMPLVN